MKVDVAVHAPPIGYGLYVHTYPVLPLKQSENLTSISQGFPTLSLHTVIRILKMYHATTYT